MAKKAKPKEVEYEEIEDGDYSIDIPEDDEPADKGEYKRPLEPFFIINGKGVWPHPETLLIKQFKAIWARDKTPNHEVALQELGYVWLMVSPFTSNVFKGYPEDRRGGIIIKDTISIPNWKPDKLCKEAMAYIVNYLKEASLMYTYFESVKFSISKIIKFNNTFDLMERNPKTGNLMLKPKDITSAAADADKIISGFFATEKRVQEEVIESPKTRGQKSISHFADPDSLM